MSRTAHAPVNCALCNCIALAIILSRCSTVAETRRHFACIAAMQYRRFFHPSENVFLSFPIPKSRKRQSKVTLSSGSLRPLGKPVEKSDLLSRSSHPKGGQAHQNHLGCRVHIDCLAVHTTCRVGTIFIVEDPPLTCIAPFGIVGNHRTCPDRRHRGFWRQPPPGKHAFHQWCLR